MELLCSALLCYAMLCNAMPCYLGGITYIYIHIYYV